MRSDWVGRIRLFNDKLREWEDYYNYHRPHGALDGQTPYERLLAKKKPASVSPKSCTQRHPKQPFGRNYASGR